MGRIKRKYKQAAAAQMALSDESDESDEALIDDRSDQGRDVDLEDPQAGINLGPFHMAIVRVDSARAKEWLERNSPDNRTISPGAFETFARDMKAGEWKLTHQAIAFNETGELIDGQHRLSAVVEANPPNGIPMLVITHRGATVKDPIDRGRARTLSDITGVNKSAISSLRWLLRMENGGLYSPGLTLSEAEVLWTRYERPVSAVMQHVKVNAPIIAAIAWAWPVDPDGAVRFAHQVGSGEMIGRGDPAYHFRDWLAHNGPHRSTESIDPRWGTALAAFNCLRYAFQGRPMSSVFMGESGYRAFASRRRALGIPHTPSADMVEPMGFALSKNDR